MEVPPFQRPKPALQHYPVGLGFGHLRGYPQHVFYFFTRKLWGYSLRGEYVRKSET